MANKVGYQVHSKMTYGRNWSADEDTNFQAHLDRLNPSAMLFLDDDGKALRTKGKFPDCAVVGRLYRSDIPEGELWLKRSPQQVFDDYKNTPKGIIRNILNEPSGYGDLRGLAVFCAEVMDLFGNAGIPIATPNFGEGNPDVDRLPELEPLWVAFDKWHDLHYYATHEYGTYRGMLFNEAGKWDVFPWRVGRFETFIVPYLQKVGHKIPRVILTEFGIDSAHDGTDKRGWKTAWDETRYAGEITAAIERVYKAPHYVGLCLFSWGNTGQKDTESDWISFDVSEAKTLHARLESMNITAPPVTPPAPQFPAFPSDFDERALTGDFRIMASPALNVRSLPTQNSALVGSLPQGTAKDVEYISADRLKPSERYENDFGGLSGVWIPVRFIDAKSRVVEGWAFNGYMALVPKPEPPPAPTLHTVTIRIFGLTLEQAQALVNNVQISIE